MRRRCTACLRYLMLLLATGVLLNGFISVLLTSSRQRRVKTRFNESETGSGLLCMIFSCRPTPARLPLCPEIPPNLEGAQIISFDKPTLEEAESLMPNLKLGGAWQPDTCQSREPSTAVIVPYRDRFDHLQIFVNYIHPFLQKQLLNYTLYIVEQTPGSRFNRASLLNIGYVESGRLQKPDCVIFHDVDLLPEDDGNLYHCREGTVRHLSAHVDEFAYRLPYDGIVGGAVAFWARDFLSINGFSNKYFGWGGEDDDLFNRIRYHGLTITRYNKTIARYKMIRHRKIYPNKERFKFLQTGDRRFLTDGLNNLKYNRTKLELRKLFTWITADIKDPLR